MQDTLTNIIIFTFATFFGMMAFDLLFRMVSAIHYHVTQTDEQPTYFPEEVFALIDEMEEKVDEKVDIVDEKVDIVDEKVDIVDEKVDIVDEIPTEAWSIRELKHLGSRLAVRGYSRMRKTELLAAIIAAKATN